MLGQRRRRWAVVVQMLYKCFVFTGKHHFFTVHLNRRQRSTLVRRYIDTRRWPDDVLMLGQLRAQVEHKNRTCCVSEVHNILNVVLRKRNDLSKLPAHTYIDQLQIQRDRGGGHDLPLQNLRGWWLKPCLIDEKIICFTTNLIIFCGRPTKSQLNPHFCKVHPSKHKTFVYYLYNVGPTSKTLGRRYTIFLCLLEYLLCHIN